MIQRTTTVDRRSYTAGYEDAIAEFCRQIRGASTIFPDGCYTGPLPPEFDAWLTRIEEAIDAE